MADELPKDSPLERATVTAGMAMHDPLALAAENARLRSSVTGAHNLLVSLMKRFDGPVKVAHADVLGDPSVDLMVDKHRDGSVTLALRKKVNTAIRRKRK